MERDSLNQRLMKTFVAELDELLRVLNDDLLALEREPDAADRDDRIQSLFRAAHSLKGASRAVGVGEIERACHRVEDIFRAVRDGERELDGDLFQLLFAAADAIAKAGRRLGEDTALDPSPRAQPRSQVDSDAFADAGPPPATPKRDGREPEIAAGTVSEGARAEAPVAAAGDGDGRVRVPTAKLDSLLALSGELLVARRRTERRHEDVADLQEMVRPWLDAWRPLAKAMRTLAEPTDSGDPALVRSNGKPAQAALVRRQLEVVDRFGEDVRRLGKKLESLSAGLVSDQTLVAQAAEPLELAVRDMRMLPFSEACEGLARAVRDLAKARGNRVELVTEGGDVALDRSVLEALRDPLRHLIRNAVDHGIELPDERARASKPERGRITLSARLLGGRVEITVADDGRGIDLDKIRETARQKGLPAPEDDRDAARLLFVSGFSTSTAVTEVSGRGIGLDAVRSAVESRRGSVDVALEPGRGARFRLTVPLTLTIQRALLVVAAGQVFAIDDERVSALLRVGSDDIHTVEGREVVMLDGAPVRVVALAELLGEPPRESPHAGARAPVVVLRAGEHRAALMVDELIAEQEIVVKNLGPRLRRVRHFAGGTILADGRVALILNPVEVVEGALGLTSASTLAAALTEVVAEVKKRLLLADDSVTTRTLEQSILEAAGYEVMAAADGMEAWQLLQERGADLLVTDFEMPRMDGVTLTETVRASKRFRELPVVLVTARESEEDKARGLEAGADAYLVKSAFDQKTLLDAIERLL